MSYRILDLEVTRPLPSITLSDGETRTAVIFRRKGVPIDFWLDTASENRLISQARLDEKIFNKTRDKILAESIREELSTKNKTTRLPSLSIAICTRDRVGYLERCLDSVMALSRDVSGITVSLEIIVVDNAPSDGSSEVLVGRYPEARYICEKKPGLNFARNRALKETGGEFLAFLDDDVVVDPLWLEGLMEAWVANPSAGAFTGLVLPYELSTRAQILFEARGGWRKSFNRIVYGRTLLGSPFYPCGAGMFGTGANMALSRKVLLEIGGFDEALDTGPPLPGGGDLDIFYRVVRGGHLLVYDPKYMVFHEHRRTLKSLRQQYWSWGLCVMAFISKSSGKDPSQRSKLFGLTRWWFKAKVRNLIKSLRGRYILPPRMVAAELFGGVVGLLGEYSRSQKRIEKIKRQFK